MPGTFHPTLTTTALYRSSSGWFETCSLKADPEGPSLISYAALQHGVHFTFYSFRASAAHIVSPHLCPGIPL
jgi:hypothetical protein